MKKLKRLLYFISVLTICSYGLRAMDRKLLAKTSGESDLDVPQTRIAHADVKIMFVLTDKNTLTFDLPETPYLKLVSRANVISIKKGPESELNPNFSYALQYRIYSAGGTLLTEHVYYHRTHVSVIRAGNSENLITSSFYVHETLLPANAETFVISLEKLNELPDKMTIQLVGHDSTIADVSLGVNYQNRLPEHKLRYTWQRMSEDEKTEIARGNVFPQVLLREDEIRNALTNYWSLLVPVGVEGMDFVRRKLYVQSSMQGERYEEEEPLSGGFYLDAWYYGVSEIPAPGGNIRFEFHPLWPDSSQINRQIEVNWHGPGFTPPQSFQITAHDSAFSDTLRLAAGLLEIKASDRTMCRLFLQSENAEYELLPEPMLVRTFLISDSPLFNSDVADSGITFHITHFKNKETPFRFDVRQIKAPDDSLSPKPANLIYDMLTENGAIWKTGAFSADTLFSHYDRLTNIWANWPVTDPHSHYVTIPALVRKIHFRASSRPILITVYNRPPELTKKTRIQDAEVFTPGKPSASRSWFPLLPENCDALIRHQRSPILNAQKRIPRDSDEILAGLYQWETLPLQNNWPVRTLFIPADTIAAAPNDLLTTLYRPIESGREYQLDFYNANDSTQVSPRLVYLTKDTQPFSLIVEADHRLHFQTTVGGLNGEVWLPPVPTDFHSFTVTASKPARLYVNGAQTITSIGGGVEYAASKRKRSAYRLTARSYTFAYKKERPEEWLSFRWFAPYQTTENLQIQLQIKTLSGKKPVLMDFQTTTQSATILNRRFDIEPAGGEMNCVLGMQGAFVDAGRSFSMPLKSDLPSGTYRVTMTALTGADGYFTIARLTAGAQESRQFFTEKNEAE